MKRQSRRAIQKGPSVHFSFASFDVIPNMASLLFSAPYLALLVVCVLHISVLSGLFWDIFFHPAPCSAHPALPLLSFTSELGYILSCVFLIFRPNTFYKLFLKPFLSYRWGFRPRTRFEGHPQASLPPAGMDFSPSSALEMRNLLDLYFWVNSFSMCSKL
jgi:hypothetical protein